MKNRGGNGSEVSMVDDKHKKVEGKLNKQEIYNQMGGKGVLLQDTAWA